MAAGVGAIPALIALILGVLAGVFVIGPQFHPSPVTTTSAPPAQPMVVSSTPPSPPPPPSQPPPPTPGAGAAAAPAATKAASPTAKSTATARASASDSTSNSKPKDSTGGSTTTTATAAYPQVIKPVRRVDWTPDKPIAEYARSQHLPLVFTNSAVRNWTAIGKWSLPYLASPGVAPGIKPLNGVKVQSGGGGSSVFRYVNDKRLDDWRSSPPHGTFRQRLFSRAEYHESRPTAVINTTISDFVSALSGSGGGAAIIQAVNTQLIAQAGRDAELDDADTGRRTGTGTDATNDDDGADDVLPRLSVDPTETLYLYFSDGIGVLSGADTAASTALYSDLLPFDYFDFGVARAQLESATATAKAAAEAKIAKRDQKNPPKNGVKSAKRLAKDAARIADAIEDATATLNRCDMVIWFGKRDVTAYPHYDCDENFFVQIAGTKRFVLAAPEEVLRTGLYPSFHPLFRQVIHHTRMDTSNAHRARHEPSNPAFVLSSTPINLYEVVLSPGDVLYLPPYWFHRVTGLEDSISINSWCKTDTFHRFDGVSRLPLPFEPDYPYTLMLHAVKQFIEMLLNELYEPQRLIAREVIDLLVLNRYATLPSMRAAPPRPKECAIRNPALDDPPPPPMDMDDPTVAPDIPAPEISICGSRSYKMAGVPVRATVDQNELSKKFQPSIDRLLDIFEYKPSKSKSKSQSNQSVDERRAIRDLHVFNYIEEMIAWAVGPDHVHDFLRCCF